MVGKHKCHIEEEEKKQIVRELKGLLQLLARSTARKDFKTRSPKNPPLCLTRRLPRFVKNYDIIPLITSNPVLEIRPTSNPSVMRREQDSPDVAYIMIEPEGNPFKTEWDEMRNVRRDICPKHNVRYGAHIHRGTDKSTLDGQIAAPYIDRLEAIGKLEKTSPTDFIDKCKKCKKLKVSLSDYKMNLADVQTEQADMVVCMCQQPAPQFRNQVAFPINEKTMEKMAAKTCSRCKRQKVSPAEMLANWGNIKLETVCLCEPLEYFFRKAGFVPQDKDFRTNVTKVPVRKSDRIYEPRNIKEICYCNPNKDQNIDYLCQCKLPNDCLKTYK
ncbi:uncharacterized protein LOC112127772 [Cimex lectularius]|uniref:Uncharacterized protein n=1 Tax=Cimex lectularius TaxID=79782 RepID=A0A8I6SUW5_CIMLE|nr:uncharacterized protein LOC112127772 [Cimex lectularius]